jgi:hypothetical protein
MAARVLQWHHSEGKNRQDSTAASSDVVIDPKESAQFNPELAVTNERA